jgi:hypothetical protein
MIAVTGLYNFAKAAGIFAGDQKLIDLALPMSVAQSARLRRIASLHLSPACHLSGCSCFLDVMLSSDVPETAAGAS